MSTIIYRITINDCRKRIHDTNAKGLFEIVGK